MIRPSRDSTYFITREYRFTHLLTYTIEVGLEVAMFEVDTNEAIEEAIEETIVESNAIVDAIEEAIEEHRLDIEAIDEALT